MSSSTMVFFADLRIGEQFRFPEQRDHGRPSDKERFDGPKETVGDYPFLDDYDRTLIATWEGDGNRNGH